jgi:hypothetical protein
VQANASAVAWYADCSRVDRFQRAWQATQVATGWYQFQSLSGAGCLTAVRSDIPENHNGERACLLDVAQNAANRNMQQQHGPVVKVSNPHSMEVPLHACNLSDGRSAMHWPGRRQQQPLKPPPAVQD